MNNQGRDALSSLPLKTPKGRSLDRRFGVFTYVGASLLKQLKVLISTSRCKKAVLVTAVLLVPLGVLFIGYACRRRWWGPVTPEARRRELEST